MNIASVHINIFIPSCQNDSWPSVPIIIKKIKFFARKIRLRYLLLLIFSVLEQVNRCSALYNRSNSLNN